MNLRREVPKSRKHADKSDVNGCVCAPVSDVKLESAKATRFQMY